MNETTTDGQEFAQNYLAEARSELATAAAVMKHCLSQLSESQVWWRPSESMNSVGNLLLHLCGNLRQRFRSVIDGLPDDRDRPREFSERGPIPTAELLLRLEGVIGAADDILARLTPSRLLESRRYGSLRGETEGTVQGVVWQTLLHLSGHVQEIIYITRLQLGDSYQFRSPPSPPPPPPDDKIIAADDVVFAGGMLPAHAPAAPAEVNLSPAPTDAPGAAPLKDYLLDLEQEFQDQNDEGKV
jgi:Protein of unknown function (DUF1572)